jgi:hypothetical protein
LNSLVSPGASSHRGRFGIAFGAERLPLIAFRSRPATVFIAFALAVLAVFGIQSVRISVKRRSIHEIAARSQVGHSANEAEKNR